VLVASFRPGVGVGEVGFGFVQWPSDDEGSAGEEGRCAGLCHAAQHCGAHRQIEMAFHQHLVRIAPEHQTRKAHPSWQEALKGMQRRQQVRTAARQVAHRSMRRGREPAAHAQAKAGIVRVLQRVFQNLDLLVSAQACVIVEQALGGE
jgi:hypothetical protein